jgi:hypothetical protein
MMTLINGSGTGGSSGEDDDDKVSTPRTRAGRATLFLRGHGGDGAAAAAANYTT